MTLTLDDAPFSLSLGALRVEQRGVAWGDASLRAPDALDRLARLRVAHRLEAITLPWLDFSHDVGLPGDRRLPLAEGVTRAEAICDGLLVEGARQAAFISNGDCAVGALWRDDRAVVMHLGLDCLWRDDGGPTLLERALEVLGGDPSAAAFWVGCAIGPCCHGYTHADEAHLRRARWLRDRFGEDVIGGRARWGPRKGQVAYDHGLMAARHAERLGVGEVTRDAWCRACAGLDDPDRDGFGLFFSNTRDRHRGRARNSTLVWLEP